MNFIKQPVKGMRDILPEEMEIREYIINKIIETYSKFGFRRIETPCVENIENLTGKQGGENEKLIFKILKRGEKLINSQNGGIEDLADCGLRYDLTVPLSRFYSNNMNDLEKPFKALQIGYVWRADRPQKGRYRQFIQCDIDILGEKTNLAEIELILATTTFLKNINLGKFKVKINDRRILKALALCAGFHEDECINVFISLDKIDKIGVNGVREELLQYYSKNVVEKYMNFFKLNLKSAKELPALISTLNIESNVLDELDQTVEIVKNIKNVEISFDPTLVRGMSYYTGLIFEIEVDGYPGSIAGGGRYDKMIEKYVNISIPACGFSIGFERLANILLESGIEKPSKNEKYAIIIEKGMSLDDIKDRFTKADHLRQKGYIVNIQRKSKNFKHQKETLEDNGYKIYNFNAQVK